MLVDGRHESAQGSEAGGGSEGLLLLFLLVVWGWGIAATLEADHN